VLLEYDMDWSWGAYTDEGSSEEDEDEEGDEDSDF